MGNRSGRISLIIESVVDFIALFLMSCFVYLNQVDYAIGILFLYFIADIIAAFYTSTKEQNHE